MSAKNFDDMAKDFDTEARIERARVVADAIRGRIAQGEGDAKSALEYGCGTGLVGLQLSDAFASLRLVDSSSEMIAQVNQKLDKLNKPAVSAFCADFMKTMPQGLAVDYIFSSLVLHHIQDTAGMLRRFYNALREGGRLLIVDLDADDGRFHAGHPDFDGHHGFEQGALARLLTQAGFDAVAVETFYHGSKSVNGKDCPYSLFIADASRPTYRQKVIATFMADGKIAKMPAQLKKKLILIEEIGRAFDTGKPYTEKEMNLAIADFYEDFCMVRRFFVDYGLFTREGGVYLKSPRPGLPSPAVEA